MPRLPTSAAESPDHYAESGRPLNLAIAAGAAVAIELRSGQLGARSAAIANVAQPVPAM